MIEVLLGEADERMVKSVESARDRLATVRTGRASPALVDRVNVDYYGTQTPLNQMANIAAAEARLLTISPYDKSALQSIEKAIVDSDLGLTPNNDGNVIRIQIPELTEERRTEMVKQARQLAEEGRVACRNIRREVMHDLKELRTGGDVGEDDEKRAETDLQKLTDGYIGEIDALLSRKETDLLEV
ncbi:MAG: ribosome recycling factor [Thermoleophilia bacterium]|nr:ribosome recycling factor [Thermoleophilia bacterium]